MKRHASPLSTLFGWTTRLLGRLLPPSPTLTLDLDPAELERDLMDRERRFAGRRRASRDAA